MFPSPAGLNPVDGITMRAQTTLHREILHLHGLLTLAISLLRTRFAILNPSFMDHITSPHIQLQIRGLDSAIRQATQAIHNGVHYIQELLTTFGMMHALNCDTTQVDAELRGCSTFRPPPSIFSCFFFGPDYDSKYDIYQFYSGGVTDSATEDPYHSYSASTCD